MLVKFFSDSPAKALKTVYPEHTWVLWRFKHLQTECWRNRDNHKLFFDWPTSELGYKYPQDIHKITAEDVFKHGAQSLLNIYYNGSPSLALESVYPDLGASQSIHVS